MSFDSEVRELNNQRQAIETQRIDLKRRFERDTEKQQETFNNFQRHLDDALYDLSKGLDHETARKITNNFQDLLWDIKSVHIKGQYAREDDYELRVSELKRKDRRLEDELHAVRRKYN